MLKIKKSSKSCYFAKAEPERSERQSSQKKGKL